LARRLGASNRDDPEFGPALAKVCAEIEADRETLKAVMDQLEVDQSKLKPLAAILGETRPVEAERAAVGLLAA
jgi:hypothetical protein